MFNLTATLNIAKVNFANIRSQLNQLDSQFAASTGKAKSFADALALKGVSLLPYTVASVAVVKLTEAVGQATRDAIKFETEVAKIAQTLEITNKQAKSTFGFIGGLSKEFAISAPKLAQVARTLAQAGLSVKQIEGATKALATSTVLASFDSIDNTTEGLIAIFSQFKSEAKDAAGVIALLNTISKKYAVESSDLVEAVKKAGGAFSSAGGSLQELLTAFTVVRDTTRESAETIGVGLNTISARLQRASAYRFFKDLGIDIRDAKGEFVGFQKAIFAIQEGIAKAGIGPKSLVFSQIVEELGGVRQQARVIPLLQERAKYQEIIKSSNKSLSDSEKDAKKVQETLGFQLGKTTQNFAELFREIESSGSFQFMIRSTLDLTNKLIDLAKIAKDIIPIVTGLFGLNLVKNLSTRVTGKPSLGILGGSTAIGLASALYLSRGFNSGGPVPGSGNKDTVPAMLTPGEYVLPKALASRIGYDKLDAMRSGVQYFAGGGKVEKIDKIIQQRGLTGSAAIQLKNKLNKMTGAEIADMYDAMSGENKRPPTVVSSQAQKLLNTQDFFKDAKPTGTYQIPDVVNKLSKAELRAMRRGIQPEGQYGPFPQNFALTGPIIPQVAGYNPRGVQGPQQQRLIGYTPSIPVENIGNIRARILKLQEELQSRNTIGDRRKELDTELSSRLKQLRATAGITEKVYHSTTNAPARTAYDDSSRDLTAQQRAEIRERGRLERANRSASRINIPSDEGLSLIPGENAIFTSSPNAPNNTRLDHLQRSQSGYNTKYSTFSEYAQRTISLRDLDDAEFYGPQRQLQIEPSIVSQPISQPLSQTSAQQKKSLFSILKNYFSKPKPTGPFIPTDPYGMGQQGTATPSAGKGRAILSSLGGGTGSAIGGTAAFLGAEVAVIGLTKAAQSLNDSFTKLEDGTRSSTGELINSVLEVSKIVGGMLAGTAASAIGSKIAEKGFSSLFGGATAGAAAGAAGGAATKGGLLAGGRALIGKVAGGIFSAAGLKTIAGGLAIGEGFNKLRTGETLTGTLAETISINAKNRADTARINAVANKQGRSFDGDKRLTPISIAQEVEKFVQKDNNTGEITFSNAAVSDEVLLKISESGGKATDVIRAWAESLNLSGAKLTEFQLAVGAFGPELKNVLDAQIQARKGQIEYIKSQRQAAIAVNQFAKSIESAGDLDKLSGVIQNLTGNFKIDASSRLLTGKNQSSLIAGGLDVGASRNVIAAAIKDNPRFALNKIKSDTANAPQLLQSELRSFIEDFSQTTVQNLDSMNIEELSQRAEQIADAGNIAQRALLDFAKKTNDATNVLIDTRKKEIDARLSFNRGAIEFGENRRNRKKEIEELGVFGTQLSDVRARRATIGDIRGGLRSGLIASSAALTATGVGIAASERNGVINPQLQRQFAALQISVDAQAQLIQQENSQRQILIESLKEEVALEQNRARSFADLNSALSGDLGPEAEFRAIRTQSLAEQTAQLARSGDVTGARSVLRDSNIEGVDSSQILNLLPIETQEAIKRSQQIAGASQFQGLLRPDALATAANGQTRRGQQLIGGIAEQQRQINANDAALLKVQNDNIVLLSESAKIFGGAVGQMSASLDGFNKNLQGIVDNLNNASVALRMEPTNVIVTLNNAQGLENLSREVKKIVMEEVGKQIIAMKQGQI